MPYDYETAPDFRDQEPVWVKYAECITAEHDKYYEVRVDLGDDGGFYITKRWGRRPDRGVGQIKVQRCISMAHAVAVADTMVAEKYRKGYRLADRPLGATLKVLREYEG